MILIALGANLPSRYGSPAQALEAAMSLLEQNGMTLTARSKIWLTAPVPVSDQPWYHNAVVAVNTRLTPLAILERLQTIENEMGRVRTVRNAPRVIDLDLIACNDTIVDRPDLIVPHPRMHSRAFVLLPLREIAPDWSHPVSGESIDRLIADLPAEQEAKILSDAIV